MKTSLNYSALFATAILLLVGLSVGLGRAPGRAPEDSVQPEAAAIVGPRECAECHEAENRTWLETAHYHGFKTLARRPEARALTEALGIRRLKTEERCIRCHFTEQITEDAQAKVIAGVSCESCHGASADWLETHGDFGGEGLTRETEDPEHRAARLAACVASGMRGPANLYDLAARCYECHLLSDPELHGAGHGIGEGFELSEAMLGEVRHNFVRGKGENASATPERKRVLYLLGRLLEVQFTLRALADVDPEGPLVVAITARAKAAHSELSEAAKLVSLPAFEELVAILETSQDLHPGHSQLRASAEAAERTARWVAQECDGTELSALEGLVEEALNRTEE